MHVRGFAEEGTTTTPFDMVVLNELDRFHLAIEVIERVPRLGIVAAHVQAAIPRRPARAFTLCARAWRGHAADPRLGLAVSCGGCFRLTSHNPPHSARHIERHRTHVRRRSRPQFRLVQHQVRSVRVVGGRTGADLQGAARRARVRAAPSPSRTRMERPCSKSAAPLTTRTATGCSPIFSTGSIAIWPAARCPPWATAWFTAGATLLIRRDHRGAHRGAGGADAAGAIAPAPLPVADAR